MMNLIENCYVDAGCDVIQVQKKRKRDKVETVMKFDGKYGLALYIILYSI